jgi:hypothetical protein
VFVSEQQRVDRTRFWESFDQKGAQTQWWDFSGR